MLEDAFKDIFPSAPSKATSWKCGDPTRTPRAPGQTSCIRVKRRQNSEIYTQYGDKREGDHAVCQSELVDALDSRGGEHQGRKLEGLAADHASLTREDRVAVKDLFADNAI